jgi:hypothetical protein
LVGFFGFQPVYKKVDNRVHLYTVSTEVVMPLSAWLLTLPTWLSAFLVIGFFVAICVSVIFIARRWVDKSLPESRNDIVGFMFANIVVIYTVLLAFVVINVWGQLDSTEKLTMLESAEAIQLYRDLNLYPNRLEAEKSLAALREFTQSVIKHEFPAMQAMKWETKTQASLHTNEALNSLKRAISQISQSNMHEQTLFDKILNEINNLLEYRTERLLMARSDLPDELWVLLVFGGVVVTSFTALFRLSDVRTHFLLAVPFSFMTGWIIHVIVMLNFPFMGSVSIHPDGYRFLIELAKW